VKPSPRFLALAVAIVPALLACSAEEYRASADREVYSILDAKRSKIIGRQETFSVEPPVEPLRAKLEAESRAASRPAVVLSLTRALEVAEENSRDFQSQKETVYSRALTLTLERWRLGFIPSATGVAAVDGVGSDAEASGSFTAAVSRLFASGATMVAQMTVGVFQALVSSSGGLQTLPSALSVAITQPLLRGFGAAIVLEPLTQADRDVVYEIRAFERFQHEFAVDVASRFYRILQQADVVENERTNYENLTLVRERNEALARAGRLSEIEVGQAQQDELSARNRWVVAQEVLESLLDAFKIFLGLPTDAPIVVDHAELAQLAKEGLVPVDTTEEHAMSVAFSERLDYRTSRDRVDDAERHAHVAADALRTGLDLSASYAVATPVNQPGNLQSTDAAWRVALSLDLPVDRLPQRNAYRSALLALEASRRDASLAQDNIQFQVREELRELRQTRESYEIQKRAVALAESRVESADLYLQAGRSSTRDLLEAREALVQARNALTAALIDYALARLSLFRDVGALRLDSAGMHVDAGVIAELRGEMP